MSKAVLAALHVTLIRVPRKNPSLGMNAARLMFYRAPVFVKFMAVRGGPS